MKSIKSPGGSMYPYFYKGGEVHCLKYGGFLKNKHRLFALMREEEEFIRRTNKQLRIWIDLYETKVTKEVLIELIQSLKRINHHIQKLTIVGLPLITRWKLDRLIKGDKSTGLNITYFKDPEDAKTWLVNE
ncbi:hypothetical protein PAE9249_02466 [Paenibacillus sp. CECT 9249]|uniref:hypothetical protein n=1 Tax=Paenibacillus sp. CECT 9249 TaxID=2845385 RepID=UPI001E437A94|nr:hypothetical protein [Paenibacillus sp. CECT 9249]CAH0119957.1 hypothetical protein PAE9249_02466 [Paenibacillus sp. CECT 9249]